jgi:hypothetical protein
MSRRLRSTESASMPPTIDSISIGASCAAMMTPTKTPERVRSYASAPSTTFCIQVPTLLENAPM